VRCFGLFGFERERNLRSSTSALSAFLDMNIWEDEFPQNVQVASPSHRPGKKGARARLRATGFRSLGLAQLRLKIAEDLLVAEIVQRHVADLSGKLFVFEGPLFWRGKGGVILRAVAGRREFNNISVKVDDFSLEQESYKFCEATQRLSCRSRQARGIRTRQAPTKRTESYTSAGATFSYLNCTAFISAPPET